MQEIINDLKITKKKKGYTNKQIAEATGIPEGTVSRVFSSKDYNFKYDTIKPIVDYLMMDDFYDEEVKNPLPEDDMLELFRHILPEKNHQIEEMYCEIEQLKEQYRNSHDMHKIEVEQLKNNMRMLRFIILSMSISIVLLILVDLGVSGVGWLRFW